ncbi:VirB3 family type IV secretion system protein [Advenella sp. WQ 585]|uniref:VirB3 family type IV secretion system protein n=1 Tax=Advenella mandrilli TaxID=2800330 RepID=A0ABS1ECE4_9BURK|nr:VirB3 family type IV secretion system protein [Advenella mandrilli]MBK1781609.1 VirB3 family type IV secretion system protein [Advenella mandrilli]
MQMEEKTFPTYGALSRSAIVMGIPLVPMAALIGCTMVVTMFFLTFIGGKALLLTVIPIPILFVFKTVSKNDDRALNILGYELLCFFYRRNARLFNKTTTILGTKYGQKLNDYQRFFEQRSEAAGRSVRFSTENIPTRD